MKKIFTFFSFFCSVFIVHCSVSAQVMFQKEVVATNLYETKQTTDSGYISVGWWNDNLDSNHQYACLIKTNAFGDTVWTRMYGEDSDVIAYSTEMTSDGGYILAGFTYSGKVYLIKTNSNGDTLWTKNFGGAFGNDVARRVHQTIDGGFIITGSTNNFGSGIYVIKTDSNGIVEWSRVFKGISNDVSYSICQTSDSGFVALGVLSAFMSNCDIVLIKMNSIGDTLWTKSYGSSGQDFAFCIQQTFNRGFAVAGFTGGNASLLITDSIGNLIWSKTYGCSGFIKGFYVSQTSDSGFVICGYTDGFGVTTWAPYVLKVNSVGDIIWSKVYADSSYGTAWSVIQTFDGGYVTAGEQNELMKLSTNGSSGCLENNATTFVTNSPIILLSNPITVTIANTTNFPAQTIVRSGIEIINICTSVIIPISGFYSSAKSICALSAVQFTDTSTNYPLSWEWTFEGGSPSTSTSQNPIVSFDSAGIFDVKLIVSNAFGIDTILMTDYMTVYDCLSVPDFNSSTMYFTVFKNPSNENISIQTNNRGTLLFYNQLGQIIFTTRIDKVNSSISTNNFAGGIYFIQLVTDKNIFTEKIILQ